MMLAALQSSVTATLRRFAARGLQSTGEPSAPQAPATGHAKPPAPGAHLGLGVELAVLEPTLQGDPPPKVPPPPSATTPPDATLRQGATPRGATPVALPSAPVAFEVLGATVGCYQILGHYASGGMCQVYRARHVSLGYECAFKVPFPPGSSEDRRRLKREARLGAMISHPSVVKFLDFGHLPDRRPYLVMEMLEGPSLRQALVGRPFEVKRACRIANQVAAGLSALHAQGIVHRDIKPRNLLLDSRGGELVKIIDLGLAKRPVVALDLMVSMQGVILGTPDYMGPEQRRGEDVDPRTDQYALGCVFFEMLTGKAVADYPSEEPARPGAPQLGELSRHDLPKGLIQIVQRMLAEDPKNRYQMMSLVENALRPFV